MKLYVILHQSAGAPIGVIHDVNPDMDLSALREEAAELQDNAARWGRPNDKYKIFELREVTA